MSLRIFLLSAISLLWPISLAADDALQLKSALEFWVSLEPVGREYLVNVERDDNAGVLYERAELSRHGQYSIYASKLANKSRQVSFTNPNYHAVVFNKAFTKHWKERHYSTDTSEAFFQHMFIMQVINPGSIREALSNNAVVERIEVLAESTGILVEFKEKLPEDSMVHPEYAGAQLRVFGVNSFPSKIELIQSKDHGGMATRLEYNNFVAHYGTRLPQQVIASHFRPADGETYNTNVYRYTYSKSTPIDPQRCTLTYYGFKEPDANQALQVPNPQ